MRTGDASGFHIAILSFAILLLAVPLSMRIGEALGSSKDEAAFIGRFLPFVLGAAVLVAFPALRRQAAGYLSRPVPPDRRLEVALVSLGTTSLAFAFSGALALWYWLSEGNAALEQHLKSAPADEQMAHAFSGIGLLMGVFLAGFVAPILEELLFRGFLFRAWQRQWGWGASMLLASTLFGLYHPHFVAAFASSVVFVCVMRRTGSLRAPIVVHSFSNLMLWYPLAGRFVFPGEDRAVGDITTWGPNLACLLFVVVALPLYLWMARSPARGEPSPADA
jgi:membrane protease YdiL (CAAX protease family)